MFSLVDSPEPRRRDRKKEKKNGGYWKKLKWFITLWVHLCLYWKIIERSSWRSHLSPQSGMVGHTIVRKSKTPDWSLAHVFLAIDDGLLSTCPWVGRGGFCDFHDSRAPLLRLISDMVWVESALLRPLGIVQVYFLIIWLVSLILSIHLLAGWLSQRNILFILALQIHSHDR